VLESASLSDHLVHCGASRGALQMLAAGVDELHLVFSGRVITSALVIGVLLGSTRSFL
jgi:hypothetical protein